MYGFYESTIGKHGVWGRLYLTERFFETVVERFESALGAFSGSTRDFTEFNAHLKDNVQRMSLSFGDLGDTLRTQIRALKGENGRGP